MYDFDYVIFSLSENEQSGSVEQRQFGTGNITAVVIFLLSHKNVLAAKAIQRNTSIFSNVFLQSEEG